MSIEEMREILTVDPSDEELFSSVAYFLYGSRDWHQIFVDPLHGRLAWGNDPGEPKWPLGEASRRVILTANNTLIVRGPARRKTSDERHMGWIVLASCEALTLEHFVNVLSLPHLSVLPFSYKSFNTYATSLELESTYA